MVKKLLLKVFTFWALILTSALGWGQCPTSVSVSADTGKTICAGTPVTFSATINGGTGTFSYKWKIDGADVGTNSTTFSTSSLENGDNVTLTVTSSDDTTCSTTSSNYSMTVNSSKTPTVTLSANTTSICPGESVIFTANNTNGGTSPQYSFFLNSGTTALQTGSSNKFTTTSLNNGDRIRVILNSSLDCTTTATAEAISSSIEVRAGTPATPGTIATSVGSSICPGTPQTYSIGDVTGATSYQWTLPSGWTGSSTSTSINVTAGTSSGSISVKALNDCGSSEAQSISITLKDGTPAVPGNITGTTSVCPGVSETYSVSPISGATEYIWTLPNGWTGTSTTNSIDVTTGASGSGNISVQAKNECGTSTAKTLAVSVKPGTPATPGVISGTAAVCPGVPETYSITAVTGATSYEWTFPDNSWTGTSTTNSITVTTGTTNGNITVKAINDCGTSETQTFAVTVKSGTPATPVAVSGSNLVCPGTSETYSIELVTGATEYIWTLPSGWTGSSTSETITVTTGQSGSGNITVKAKNDCGTSDAASIAVSVDKPAPVMTGSITGTAEVCSTASGLVYSIPAITNATDYIWTVPTGWNITGGSGTNSITVSPSSNSGNISVIAKNTCGESASSANFVVTSTTGEPPTPGTITAPNLPTSAICPPATGIQFTVPLVDGADSYFWTVPAGWEITSGNGTNSIVVKVNSTAATTSNASVDVQAENICGKSPKSTLSGIAIDSHVVTNAGPDQTVCEKIATINIEGTYSFSGTNKNLKPTWTVGAGMGSFGDAQRLATTFTPTQAALDAGSVVLTLNTDAPSGACGPGKDEMTIFFKSLPTATITATSPVCSGNTSTLTFSGTPNSRVTFRLPNNSTSTIDIGASGTATVTTAALTANSTYSLVSSVNLDTPSCSNTLSGSATINVTPIPTAELSYADAPFCTSLTTGQSPTLSGTHAYTGGVYSSTPGLVIDSSTGAVTPSTSTPGTYTVTYKTPASGGCEEVVATTEVTITKEPTATILYTGTPFCTSDSDAKPVTLEGTDNYSGGTFSAPDGLTIDSSTGAITASSSAAGTYTVTYETPSAGGCSSVTTSTQVIITEAPTATISYADAPFCASDGSEKAVTLTGTNNYTDGTYSAPAGLSINTTSGAINPSGSTVGTYTVTYTTPATSGCGEVTATTEVAITQTPSVQISYSGPFCTSDATIQPVVFNNGIGAYKDGTFSSNPGGLNLDPDTGGITAQNSTPGTYTVFYTIPASLGCDVVVVDTEVTITKLPQVTISYNTPLCNSDDPVGVSYSSTFGDYSGGIFSATAGLIINAEGTIDPQASTPGIHTVTYTKDTEGDGCDVIEATTQVEVFEKVQITTQPVNFGTCSSNPASFEVVATGDNLQYQWYKKDAGGTFVQINGETNALLSFNNATSANAGEYHVVVSSSNAVCSSETSDPVTLNIDEDIIITKPAEDITICEDDYETLSFEYEAHANGAELSFQWIKDGNPINETTDKYVMTKSGPTGTDGVYTGTLTLLNIDLSDDGVYAVEIDGPEHFTCSEATSKSFTFRVNKRPEKPVTAAVEYCLNASPAALSAIKASPDNELLWYSYDATADEYIYLGTSITPSTSAVGTTSYWVTQKQPNTCESDPQELVVSVYDKPEPVATETIVFEYCFEETVSDPISITPADGSTLNWYDAIDATTALDSAPTPNTSEVKLTSYWVSQTLTSTGCESDRTKVDIIINDLPNVTVDTAEGFSTEICLNTSTKLIATGATNYTWYFNETEIGTGPEITIDGEAIGTFEYKIVGTDNNNCVNENIITIKVEEPSEGGTVSGPSSVCETQNEGTLTVADFKGEIQRWESSTDGINWTSIAGTTETLDFQNITRTTTFRAIVKNGVCAEVPSSEISISIDPVPIGGELAFEGFGRTVETCSNPGPDYNIPLNLTGQTGDIVRWRYKEGSATEWSFVVNGSDYFTGTTLSPDLIRSLGINQSTVFEVEIASGACTPNVFSQSATLGIVSSDIAPSPVTVTPGVVCIGDPVTLSGQTGYGTGPGMEAGAFDYSSITNKGWRITDSNGNYTNFDSSADNGVAAIWLRTNPLPLKTYNLSTGQLYTQNWDSSAGDEGNKGFAIVSGPNNSILETSIFNLFAVDSPVLTFDQAYNLRPGSAIYVEISTDGGATYDTINPLFELVAPGPSGATSGYYESFGDDGPGDRTNNKLVLDLSAYESFENLRIRFRYEGTLPGDVWAVDAISLPVEPTNVDLTWTDYTDPDNPVIIGTNNTEQWTPTLIGWNDFEIRTKLTFDSTGQQCPVVENFSTISVYVFDKYTSTATAIAGSCGSNQVQLSGLITNSDSVEVTEFPTRDGYSPQWEVISGPDGYTFDSTHFTNDGSITPAINDPNASFSPNIFGTYTLRWAVNRTVEDEFTNETCPPVYNDITFNINDCTALDFDGVDDHIIVADSYATAQTIETWIRPEAENGPGSGKVASIYSSQNYELFLNASGSPVLLFNGKRYTSSKSLTLDDRWYHIAVVLANPVQMFIDGIEINIPNTTSTDELGTGGQFVIGGRYNGENKEPDNYFSGWIDELRIWNTPLTEKQIRFMMNQRIKLDASGIVANPLSGEVVPNFTVAGSYYISGTNNLDKDGDAFFDVPASNLIGYYRLISANPDPLGIYNFPDNLKPTGGLTPDHSSVSKVDGRLYNIETDQQNTSPTPYVSIVDGQAWATVNTWAYYNVWDAPNSMGIDGSTPINWNIARVDHNITSSGKDITMLGVLSKTPDKVLTIDSDKPIRITHYLLLDGNMDLIGESQLLQDHGSILAEESIGWLQRDQQGKKLSFNYNYWSSPVSAQGSMPNNASYNIFDVLRDSRHKDNPNAINYMDQYAAADGALTNPMTLSTYWMWKFKGSASLYKDWYWIGSMAPIETGEGYTMKGTDGTVSTYENSQNYTFRGKPHNGNITLSFEAEYENYLVGNPYPSALDANQFIQENLEGLKIGEVSVANANFNGTIYFWSHFSGKSHHLQQYVGGYAAYNLSGGVEPASSVDQRINNTGATGGERPEKFIPVGQGFFVNKVISATVGTDGELDVVEKTGGNSLILKNTQRAFAREADGESVFHSQEKKTLNKNSVSTKTSEGQKKIWLKFKSPMKYHRQLLVTADPNASSGFDLGYDAPLIEDIEEDMYWAPDNYKFVIQGVNNFDLDQELNLEFKVKEKGEITLSIDELKNIPSEMNIFIRDSLLQVTHDLRAEDYIVESEAGTFNNRFKLVFHDRWAVQEPEEPILEEGPIEVIYFNGTREILIKNPELLKISRVYLNNMLGQQVHVYYNVPQDKRIPLPVQRFSSGVYVVKVHTEKGVIVKKVILE